MPAQEKVLIIDDEPAIREVVARSLVPHGYDCRSAADAEEALAAAALELPALALVDLRLAGPDGMWLLGHFKKRWPDMAVVMLTGVTDARTAIECLKRGADDYLMKPVHPEEIALSVRRAIERVRLLRENRQYQVDLERMVKERTAQIQHVFNVIDKTYQQTLEALVSPARLEPASAALAAVAPLSDSRTVSAVAEIPAVAVDPRGPPTSPSQNLENDREVELSTLRSAGELISRGASPLDMAASLAGELVKRDAARFVRLWVRQRERRGLELAVEKGGKGTPGLALAERALSSRAVEAEEGRDAWMVSAPILVRGRVEAVWQVGGEGRQPVVAAALVERVALLLSAALAREREAEDWRKTARELDLFYEMASATRYTLDLQSVAQFIMESLHKIVDYDVAGLLLLDKPPLLHIQTRRSSSAESIERVRAHILNTLRLTCGLEPGQELATRVSRIEANEDAQEPPQRMRSFINTPLTQGGAVVGLFHVSSAREDAFSPEDVLFFNRAARFLASSVQGIRDVLAAVKGRVERMVEHMTDGVLMLDARGEVVAMNQAARSILKVDASDDALDLAALTRALEFDPLQRMRAERRALRRVVVLQGVPYQAQLSPVEDGAGDLAGAVLAFRNFSQEQQVDEMKSEFISIVSHEIRTPLTVIKNAVDLMARERLGAVTPEQSRFLGLARRNIEQLAGLVNDLLDLSKIEAGKFHIRLRPLALGEAVETVASSFQPQAQEKGIVLESAVAADLPTIHGDLESIRRVLVNLVANALKFTDRGGQVRVEASSATESPGSGSRELVRVVVSDSGVGIPSEHLEAIFDKFHQVDQSRTQGVAGTGLGLPITRELVKAHHGRIWAESEPGRGSRFIFVIPVLEAQEVFFRALERDRERAERAKTSLALVVMRLAEPESLRSRLGDERYAAFLGVVEASAQKVTRRSTDHVEMCRDRAELVAVLPETSRQGGRAFGERLLQEVQAVSASVAGAAVPWSWAEAAYPENGTTAEAVYRLAQERSQAPVAQAP